MSERSSSSASGGIGVFGLLGVLFVGLKLTGVIDWSWWWVTAPFWGSLALALLLIALFFGGAFLIVLVKEFTRAKRRP
jgi:hypothetical protein